MCVNCCQKKTNRRGKKRLNVMHDRNKQMEDMCNGKVSLHILLRSSYAVESPLYR